MSKTPGVEGSIHIVSLKKVYFGRRKNRADRAVRLVKKYIVKHYREAEKITIDPAINNYLWSRGREKPPRRLILEVRFDKESKTARVFLVKPSKLKKA